MLVYWMSLDSVMTFTSALARKYTTHRPKWPYLLYQPHHTNTSSLGSWGNIIDDEKFIHQQNFLHTSAIVVNIAPTPIIAHWILTTCAYVTNIISRTGKTQAFNSCRYLLSKNSTDTNALRLQNSCISLSSVTRCSYVYNAETTLVKKVQLLQATSIY